MEKVEKKLCPFCAGEIPSDAILCKHCRGDLRRIRIVEPKAKSKDRYKIVADGCKFGIAFQGEVKVHGRTLKEAESTIWILNNAIEETKEALSR
jgi:hypothetical protein